MIDCAPSIQTPAPVVVVVASEAAPLSGPVYSARANLRNNHKSSSSSSLVAPTSRLRRRRRGTSPFGSSREAAEAAEERREKSQKARRRQSLGAHLVPCAASCRIWAGGALPAPRATDWPSRFPLAARLPFGRLERICQTFGRAWGAIMLIGATFHTSSSQARQPESALRRRPPLASQSQSRLSLNLPHEWSARAGVGQRAIVLRYVNSANSPTMSSAEKASAHPASGGRSPGQIHHRISRRALERVCLLRNTMTLAPR